MIKRIIVSTSRWILFIMALGLGVFIFSVRTPQLRIEQNALSQRSPASLTTTPGSSSRAQYCTDLHAYVCKSSGITKDPTGSVERDIQGEVRALRLYESIIRKHPDWKTDQIDEQLVRELFTPKRKKRITAAFDYARSSVRRFIQSQPEGVFTPKEKRALQTRINALKLELPPPAILYADEPDLFTRSDVIYERLSDGSTRIRVGGAFILSVSSWYNLVFSFAHEIGHAIDPCELRAQHLSIPAYDRLSACFVKQGIVTLRKDRQECSRNDQLSESFADWIAAHISAEALTAFASEFDDQRLLAVITNSVRDLCEEDRSSTEYPSPSLRIKNLFGLHPKIRSLLACEAAPQNIPNDAYCDWSFNLTELPKTNERDRAR